ncbi:hypothetical protein GPJ56_001466 [Histomonas meleagridis]|uniref:uncharacterized protein n=1 Tax=Histomonas meleagridis TaxID=135588 RepID=UPI003559D36B|nr:hypothetical protein GPJ56_001466 [Histomonas meleagridis]KAH0798227.1 hypothetical protein GO595_009073 [Histomonas meleagridis]
MRLNIENTLIQDNLYPLAGYREKDVNAKFVSVMKPIEQDVLQIQAALLLHNIPLFIVLAIGFIGYFFLAYLLSKTFPSLVSAVILVPTFHLFYCLGGMKYLRKLYLAKLPELAADNKRRVRSLEEIVPYFAPLLKWGWRVAFFVYRTYLCPNIVDTSALIICSIIIGCIFKLINFFILMLILVIFALAIPAILTMTPAGDFIEKYINDLKAKRAQKDEKKEEPKSEVKKEEPKSEEKKEEEKKEEPKEEEKKEEPKEEAKEEPKE